ncbi:conserved hypothetical protein [Talaromyces stipitatus ATCC 10500]|uniref:Polarized growth protein (Boi2) n=1 Tax=Talaromyces stipitatus (strain ATCC 10500 / CBS 375.48 / QM 6759 / NRRL 1006) TaxID=441959 RepID=B8MEC4_TALSN|nr:uncharacterized protein TSTA_016300 [Talaromyces stipitatus ATCC 10500]EED16551.1 conserved hypothetical protein [Talaromyces stipitatus ATCC 10500]
MSTLRTVLQKVLVTVLIPLSISSALCLYLYPVLQGCAFPLPRSSIPIDGTTREESSRLSRSWTGNSHGADWNLTTLNVGREDIPESAIFRLLVLADPQIEGDSSLPSPEDKFVPRLRRHWMNVQSTLLSETSISLQDAAAIIGDTARMIFVEDIPSAFRAARKRLDLLGNDYYLAHIYRTLSWWSRPTHVTVLGDLIGSQWVTDEEFENRGWRFWQRVFRGGQRVDDDTTITGETARKELGSEELETLQRYNSPWANKIINVAGNHDIGYAGDVSRARLKRFERVFGRANWDVRFAHPLEDLQNSTARPTLHIINLNDLTLDGPAMDPSIQSDSYTYINDILAHRSYPVEDQTSFTLLLTHVPLYKRDGICIDGPYFTFFDEEDTPDNDSGEGEFIPRWRKDALREQNHLSEHVSTNGILEGLFGMSGDSSAPIGGMGRRGLILTGHDHEGCDVVHFVNRDQKHDTHAESEEGAKSWHWDAMCYSPSSTTSTNGYPSIREVTLRSMMGEYGGNAALLSLWFDADPEVNQWRYEIQMCPAGVQHIWWAVHGLAVACVIGLGVVVGLRVLEGLGILTQPVRKSHSKGKSNKH